VLNGAHIMTEDKLKPYLKSITELTRTKTNKTKEHSVYTHSLYYRCRYTLRTYDVNKTKNNSYVRISYPSRTSTICISPTCCNPPSKRLLGARLGRLESWLGLWRLGRLLRRLAPSLLVVVKIDQSPFLFFETN
jgi:hypothetical protein